MMVGFCIGGLCTVSYSAEKEEPVVETIDDITVTAEQPVLPGGYMNNTNKVGILGDVNVLDVPFTQRNYTKKTIELFQNPNQPLNGVLANNPSVMVGSSSPMYTDFTLRGVNMNASQYYLNNIPDLFGQTRSLPTWVLDSVEIVSGPSTVLNGSTGSYNGTNGKTAPPGTLRAFTQKASLEPQTQYTQQFSGRSVFTEMIDVGRRFGNDHEWGIQCNARLEDGEMAIKGTDIEEKTVYLNLDHIGEKSKTNLFAGVYDWELKGGQRWFKASNVTEGNLVSPPDSDTNLGFDGQTKSTDGYLVTFNHEQKLSQGWVAFFNSGYGNYSEQKYDPNGGSLYLYDDGILSADLRNYKVERITTYFQGGVSNETVWGNIKNMTSFALDYDKFKSRDAKVTESDGIIGNVFDGVSVVTAFSEASLDGVTYSYEEVMSATLADRIEYKNVSLYLAGQFRTNEVTSASGDSFDKNAFNPTVAVAYKPVDSVSVYASYAESYTRPLEVSASYDNAGEIFEPIKNKQYEIGVKYKTKKLLNTLSFFDLNEGAYIDQDSDGPMGTIYSQAGENRFKGIEYTVTGKLFDDWNIMGGVMYIDASREKNKKGSEYKNGWESIGVPEYNAVLAAEYEFSENLSANGRMNYSDSFLVNDNGVTAPSRVTFDAGVNFKTTVFEIPTYLSVSCINVTNNSYWLARGTTLVLSEPRTFLVAAKFNF